MKDVVLLILCVGTAIGAIVEFWRWLQVPPNQSAPVTLIISIVCLVIAIVCGLLFLIPRVNKEEEIHITQ